MSEKNLALIFNCRSCEQKLEAIRENIKTCPQCHASDPARIQNWLPKIPPMIVQAPSEYKFSSPYTRIIKGKKIQSLQKDFDIWFDRWSSFLLGGTDYSKEESITFRKKVEKEIGTLHPATKTEDSHVILSAECHIILISILEVRRKFRAKASFGNFDFSSADLNKEWGGTSDNYRKITNLVKEITKPLYVKNGVKINNLDIIEVLDLNVPDLEKNWDNNSLNRITGDSIIPTLRIYSESHISGNRKLIEESNIFYKKADKYLFSL